MIARWILLAGLALVTLGMVAVVLAVTVRGLFFTGVYLLDAALVTLAIAGAMSLMAEPERT